MLRRRTMKNSALPANGVYCMSTDGNFYTSSDWATAGKTANGVAVITEECNFLIALTESADDAYKWGGYGTLVSTLTNYSSTVLARSDYDGYNNTIKIISALGSWNTNAAVYCTNYAFPNGNKGYLPAYGEMFKAYSNISEINTCLSKMGGTTIKNNTGYWSSTQEDAYYAYFLRMQDNYTNEYNKSWSRCTRAFGRLNIS